MKEREKEGREESGSGGMLPLQRRKSWSLGVRGQWKSEPPSTGNRKVSS